jgi:peptide/nickel transport system substrate-binding protein
MTTRRTAPYLALVVAAAFLTGPLLSKSTGAQPKIEPKRGGVLRVAEREAPNLDPHLSISFLTHHYASLIYSHLVRFPHGPEQKHSGDFSILPDLAERWDLSADGKTYTFHLRKGVRFHNKPPVNGREVTAQDVKYSLERFKAKSGFRSRFDEVQTIEVVDPSTVRITTKEPFAPLLNHLASPTYAAILPREAEEKFGNFNSVEAAVGTGPFILRSYQKGVKMRYERNPTFHLKGLPYLDAVEIEITPDPAARLSMLRAGRVELVQVSSFVSIDDARAIQQSHPHMIVTPVNVLGQGKLYMRTDQPPFNDVRVRRAVSLAIDRKAMRESLFHGEGCLDNGPVPCALADWKLDLSKEEPARVKHHLGYDPQEARRLLGQAGFPGGLTTPMWHWPGYAPPWPSLYELVAENLERAGIKVELKPQEYGAYISTTYLGKFDKLAFGPVTPFTEVDDFLYGMLIPGQPNNRSSVNDPELTPLLVAQRRALDPKERKKIVDGIQRYLLEKAYYVFIPQVPFHAVFPPYLKGHLYHDGYGMGHRIMWAWLDK